MGIYDRPYYQDEYSSSPRFGGQRSIVVNLIIINAVIFVVDTFLYVPEDAARRLSYLIAMHSDTLSKPWMWWQSLTYGFAHDPRNALHLAGNMLGLFFLGGDVERHYGRKVFLRLYLTSIVLCSVVWGINEQILGRENGGLIGASGAVTTVVMLFALNFPRRTILFMLFIPMPAWVFGVLLVLFNLFAQQGVIAAEQRVAYDVHLIGAAYGFLFFRTRWEIGGLLPSKWSSGIRLPKRRPKLKVHDPESRYRALDEQADAILEKLHRDGESSLTSKERRILEDYSRRMQQKHR